MNKFIHQNRILFLSVLLFTIAGAVYSLTTASVFSSKSHIALFRLKIETPDKDSEESRNRWVWIRDGLNLKSALVPDSMLEEIINSNSTAQEKSHRYPSKQLMMDYLKSLINIQFTGADENNFIVLVKAPSPTLAFDLNSKIFERIKYLATEADQSNFNGVLDELRKKQLEFKSDPETFLFYEDKIRKMIFSQTVEQKQRENAFQVISKPTLNEHPTWPNHKLIIILSAFIGLVIGFGLEFFLKFYQREK